MVSENKWTVESALLKLLNAHASSGLGWLSSKDLTAKFMAENPGVKENTIRNRIADLGAKGQQVERIVNPVGRGYLYRSISATYQDVEEWIKGESAPEDETLGPEVPVVAVPFGVSGRRKGRPRASVKTTEPKPQPVVEEKPTEPTLSEQPLPAILDELLRRLGTGLKQALVEVISSPEVIEILRSNMVSIQTPVTTQREDRRTTDSPVVPRHNPAPNSGGKPRKPSVLIVGLPKPAHVMETKDMFGACFDLRFIDKDKLAQLTEACKRVDHTIVMTSHVSHANSQVAEKNAAHYIPLHGGKNLMLDKLAEMNLANRNPQEVK